ncbi:hypothetical protein BJ944DRAFT_273156 [Cunninghamella echinulata]|nr:hypothetical protein BJ944DRAFT_273156 [Cunninghamella echinulata]
MYILLLLFFLFIILHILSFFLLFLTHINYQSIFQMIHLNITSYSFSIVFYIYLYIDYTFQN